MNTERNYLNYIKASLLSGVILVLFISVSYAETYYVSPTGSAGWKESVSIETPCSAATAMKDAVAGDTVYFREVSMTSIMIKCTRVIIGIGDIRSI